GQTAGGGNGLIGGSRSLFASAGASYTGVRKWNFGIDGRYYSMNSLQSNTSTSAQWYAGGAGFSYSLMRYTHLTGHFDVTSYNYGVGQQLLAKRASLGLAFAPKNIPLS